MNGTATAYDKWFKKEGVSFLESEEGQKMYEDVKNYVQELLPKTGVIRVQEIEMGMTAKWNIIDSFELLACVDKLVEEKLVRQIPQSKDTFTQHRIFEKA